MPQPHEGPRPLRAREADQGRTLQTRRTRRRPALTASHPAAAPAGPGTFSPTAWRRVAARRKHEQDVIRGFGPPDEPDDRAVTADGDDWQTLAGRDARAIREIDPLRTLIIEPARRGSPDGFLGFEPLDLPGVVYSFHMYSPFQYTRQGADAPAPPVAYPGRIDGRLWDRAALEASLAPAVAFARKHRVHLFVGEFSAIRGAPGADAWLADVIDIFEAHGWDWTYHSFREWHGGEP